MESAKKEIERFTIEEAGPSQLGSARMLFREYEARVGVDLSFQGFEQELANLPGFYGRPRGFIFLALLDGNDAGCIALKPLADGVCEMKRLFVRSQYQGHGIGRKLAEACLSEARAIGYKKMCLDTLQQMKPAIALYRSLGFREREPYYDNPLQGVVYMERELS